MFTHHKGTKEYYWGKLSQGTINIDKVLFSKNLKYNVVSIQLNKRRTTLQKILLQH